MPCYVSLSLLRSQNLKILYQTIQLSNQQYPVLEIRRKSTYQSLKQNMWEK